MTIGTTNVGVSTVRAELGLSYSAGDNISLSDMNTKHIVIDLSNTTDSRFTLTKISGVTMTADDTATSNQNALDSNPSGLGEWRSYDLNGLVFSSYDTSTSSNDETVTGGLFSADNPNACFLTVRNSVELYCSRVGNDIVWYGGEGRHGSTHTSETEGGNVISSDTEVARLAGAATTSSTGDTTVSVASPTTEYTSQGIWGASPVAVSSGSTSSQLTSTNTKIGYEHHTTGVSECHPSGATNIHRWSLNYTVTPVGMNARTFKFYTGYNIYARNPYGGQDCC